VTVLLPERSITAYLTLAFSGLTVVLTVALAEAVGAVAGNEIKAGIGQGLAELARQTADKLDRGLAERYREVQLLSRNQLLIAEERQPAQRRAILDDRQATYRWYAWIGLAGLDGKVRLSTQAMLEGADVSQRPWFRNALAGPYVGDVHDAVLLAGLLPGPGNEPGRFVDIAFPYQDGAGKPAGVVGAHLSWQWAAEVRQSVMQLPPLADGAATARRGMDALIVSRDGVVLLGPAGLQGRKLATGSARAAQPGGAGYALETWPDGRRYLAGYSRTRGHDAYPGLGWSIIVRQGVDEAYAPVRAIQRRVLWTGAALAVLFSILGFLLARRLQAMIAHAQDISGRKKVEQMKNEFIATVSHELRTPLTSVRASLAMLASGMAGELPDDTRQLVEIAHTGCERLVQLVSDVADLEQMELDKMAFDFQPQALLPLAHAAIGSVQDSAAQAHVTLVLEPGVDAASAWVLADRDRMIQVVAILLANAVKFSPPGGRVTVTVERMADGGWAAIRVADQGPGIPEAFRDRIFQKFAQADSTDTRQKGGTGLGLSICKGIVERHGGEIGFTSKAGHGTEFTVRLKAAAPA
jgi:signal transduction histidine kinase